MNSIKLLGIAPYEELNQSMLSVAQQFKNLSIDSYTANLTQGRELAIELAGQGYDAIISRGGTASLIEEVVDIPVIDVSISIYDILSSIKLAYNYSQEIAIVGYESITKIAHLLCNILQYNIQIITIEQAEDTKTILQSLKEQGCQLVLCDAITNQVALTLSINTILITSGQESIQAAYQQAINFTSYLQTKESTNQLLQKVLKNQSLPTFLLDQDGQLFLTNLDEKLTQSIQRFLQKKDVLKDEEHFYHTYKGQNYQLKCRKIQHEDKDFLHCEVKAVTPPLIQQQFGVTFQHASDIVDSLSKKLLFASFIQEKNLELMPPLLKHYRAMMIFGKEGTTKTSLAYSTFLQFPQNKENLITINCKLYGDRLWKYLTNTNNGPLLDSGNTLLFQHIEELTLADLQQLITLITDTHLLQRNNILFTYTTEKTDADKRIFKEIMQELNCGSLYAASLAERQAELTSIITLLLNKINVECHKQVIGFEPQAIQALQQFHWSGNFYQLESVIKRLVLATTVYYISEHEVSLVLSEERKHQPAPIPTQAQINQQTSTIIEEKTLFDYNQDIVRTVLDYNKGNQTKTAKQLGISRTTLWRYLKID